MNGCPHTIYADIEGWMFDGDLLRLRRACAETRGPILEIGSFCGLSTAVLSENGRAVVCIDPFEGGEDLPNRDTYSIFRDNLTALGRWPQLHVIRAKSQDVLRSLGNFDLIFVDGSHTEQNALTDIIESWQHLSSDGWLIIDDIAWGGLAGQLGPVALAAIRSGVPWKMAVGTKMAEAYKG